MMFSIYSGILNSNLWNKVCVSLRRCKTWIIYSSITKMHEKKIVNSQSRTLTYSVASVSLLIGTATFLIDSTTWVLEITIHIVTLIKKSSCLNQ